MAMHSGPWRPPGRLGAASQDGSNSMQFARILFLIAAFAFFMAVLCNMAGSDLLGVTAEGYSRSCTNLLLFSIVILMLERARFNH